MKSHPGQYRGFTLIELVMVMIIIAILSGIGARSLIRVFNNANVNGTIAEMRILAEGIVGNPNIMENNIRTNYGYIGDTGQLPPTLRDLVSNVSGIPGWDGPYIDIGFADDPDYYLTDAWGNSYVYSVPSDHTQPPVIYTPDDGDTITQKIGNSVNELLGNTIKVRLLTSKNVEVDGSSGKVEIQYGGSYHSLSYNSSNGYYLGSVPIGIHKVRAVSAGDTVLKSMSVSPGNRTTSDNIEMTIYATYGNVTYVSGSATVETATQNEVYFDISNSGSTTMPINKMTLSWSAATQSCWNCATPYLESVSVAGNAHWTWNVNSTALSPTDAQIILGNKIQIYAGDMTIGPLVFKDAADGTGATVDMRGTSFTIKFQSQTAPTQTVTFSTTGVCSDPTLSLNGTVTSNARNVYFPLKNSGYIPVELTSIVVSTDFSASTAYLERIDVPSGTIVWQADNTTCGSVPRQRIDSNIQATASFSSCSYTNPTWNVNQSRTLRMRIYKNTSGTAAVTGGFSGTVFDLTFNYACGTSQTTSIPIP
ncbi:MAG: prepilin-type N-terminal cleavage/methylation domain-containing protein [FCB group bacterium]|nr:prepilin-type N-terminal cleavage/methylation domain-containing protein [FCB group bacterium]